MANFQDKIAKLFPQATIEGDNMPMISIPDNQWHDWLLLCAMTKTAAWTTLLPLSAWIGKTRSAVSTI